MASRRNSHDRKLAKRQEIPRILIVCEGTSTEPSYFRAFRVTSVVLDIEGIGMNTLSLVKETIELRKTEGTFDQVWCVFDLDNFPKQNFDMAIQLAQKEQIRVAYSNESFELWYILHFDYLIAAISRQQYIEKLNGHLGKSYQKNDPEIYEKLLTKQKPAIQNAKRLLDEHHPKHLNPSAKGPCTTVYELVEELNKYVRD